MDMQNVSNLQIPEGMVKTIHDEDSRLLWGAVGYDTKYAGDTTQTTYTGKNLIYTNPKTNLGITASYDASTGVTTISGQATDTYATFNVNNLVLPTGTYTLSIEQPAPVQIGVGIRIDGGTRTPFAVYPGNTSRTFTVPENMVGYDVYISGLTVGTDYSFSFRLQLESGSTDTPFEPYVGGVPAPNLNYPQDIQVVTGAQVVSITGGTNTQNFTVDLGSTELAKIGTYQDYIYKSGDDWYIHKEIGKTLVTGSSNESWLAQTTNVGYMYRLTLSGVASIPATEIANLRSDYFTPATGQQIYNVISGGYIAQLTTAGYIRFNVGDTTNKLSDFKTWLSSHNTTVYYALATPTDTKITDATLAGQLNSVHGWLTRYGHNATVSGGLPIVLRRDSLQ